MKNRMKGTIVILMIGMALTACNLTNYAQDKTDITNLKEQSLCVLEDTEGRVVYLTNLVRLVQNLGDEKKHYAGGEEFFLRYETMIISRNDNKSATLNQAILHCKPERIATPDGRNYDTAAIYTLPVSSTFFENGSSEELIESEKKWSSSGLDNDAGIASKIVRYYEKHRDTVSISQDDLDYYMANFW